MSAAGSSYRFCSFCGNPLWDAAGLGGPVMMAASGPDRSVLECRDCSDSSRLQVFPARVADDARARPLAAPLSRSCIAFETEAAADVRVCSCGRHARAPCKLDKLSLPVRSASLFKPFQACASLCKPMQACNFRSVAASFCDVTGSSLVAGTYRGQHSLPSPMGRKRPTRHRSTLNSK